jgi:hypothetical protein
VDASDRELQQYLFDLQGDLVIHNVLGAAEVADLNRLIDAQRPSPRETGLASQHGVIGERFRVRRIAHLNRADRP